MIEKSASVHWEGPGKKRLGQISTETSALQRYFYGFACRFEDDRRATNSEELLAAAHAACFSTAFSFACEKAGFATSVPGIDEARFQEIAASAKRDCPLSKALAGVAEISLQATLHNGAK